jgi:glycosyltransferase involved in cell wall biosynthesis
VKVHGSDINVMARDATIRRQLRSALSAARGVIAVSGDLVGKVTALGARAADTLLLHNGIDRSKFQPRDRASLRNDLGLPSNRRSILFVGNLKRDKGVMDLLDAFRALSEADCADVDLEIVGSGALQGELAVAIDASGANHRVRLHGARPHDEIAAWLGACELLCLPSHAEGIPNVVLEAQACGRPVVATRIGGIPEVLDASAGLLVEPRAPALLAAALHTALRTTWDPQAIASSLIAQDWRESAVRLCRFIESHCAVPP